MNITVVSASQQKANQLTTFILGLLRDVPFLQHLQPRPNQRCSTLAFDVGPATVKKDPSVSSLGITGQLTGGRADLIIPDDVETPSNSETLKMREKLAEKIKEFDAILKPGGEVVYLGTPQCMDSIYNLLPERGYPIRVWPSEYPDEAQAVKYGGTLAPQIRDAVAENPSLIGHTTDPERFSDLDLAERKASYGRAGYALQFLLDTQLSDADRHPLHLADLIIHPVDLEVGPERLIWAGSPEYTIQDLPIVGIRGDRYYRPMALGDNKVHPWASKIMAIDPAGRGKDETTYAVAYHFNGFTHIPDVGGLKGYEEPTLRKLSEIAKAHKVGHIIIEPNFGDGMFTKLFLQVCRNIHQCKVEEMKRHSTQKEKRIIDTLEPVMSSHRLVVDPRLIQRDYRSTEVYAFDRHQEYQLFYQMTRLTRDKGSLAHDDRIDVLAMAVGHFANLMATDVQDGIERLKWQALEEEARVHHEHVFGVPLEDATTWVRRVT